MATAQYARRSCIAMLTLMGTVASFEACASTGRSAGGTAFPASQGLTLLVRNDSWLQVTIYMLRGSTRYRLGAVGSMNTEIFRIPRDLYALSGTVQILADPIGRAQAYATEPITIAGARQIELTVAEYLPNSRVMLR